MKKLFRWVALFFVIALIATLPGAAGAAGVSTRVSVETGGGQSIGGDSCCPVISSDGRYVAFASDASNLAVPDVMGMRDAFVHDRRTITTIRASVPVSVAEINADVGSRIAISANGRYVVFDTVADNVTDPFQSLGFGDVFFRDTKIGTTELISIAADGSEADGDSTTPYISADGRYVAFTSKATNLTSGVDTNGAVYDAFVRDRKKKTTTLISVSAAGLQGAADSAVSAISSNGRYVAFYTMNKLVAEDNNDSDDIYLYNLKSRAIERVSVKSDGNEVAGGSESAALSADGRYVAFISMQNFAGVNVPGAYQVYLRDRKARTTICVSTSSAGTKGDGSSFRPSLSADGRFVAFYSDATNLVSDDNVAPNWRDVFVHDVKTGVTERVSETADGVEGNGEGAYPILSADGAFVAFTASADNLVDSDTNGDSDVFVACNPTLYPALKTPANGAALKAGKDRVKIAWTRVSGVKRKLLGKFDVQVATDVDFTNIVLSKIVKSASVQVKGLVPATVYYWRVALKAYFVPITCASPPIADVLKSFTSLT